MEKVSKRTAIKSVLDKLYNKYNHRDLIKPDPLQFVYQYDKPSDREIVALLAADLAYGRVEQIQKSLTNLLERMGESPYEFVRGFELTKIYNSLIHGKPDSGPWNQVILSDGSVGHASSKIINRPDLCDEVCAQVIPWVAVIQAMMAA